jgi:hypothetical protein
MAKGLFEFQISAKVLQILISLLNFNERRTALQEAAIIINKHGEWYKFQFVC